ncbi:poly-gamma-glutamate hydrolase family protein [Streptomyces sp. NBC_01255]|uniref:poly-gamma-glutamate hydrolase family protein n=1 Tax=Streptomyces sp. NBC_01255 TaxID=2903798 RepID=UPI002E354D84|nr:poly-gamma-glutamate hydrolase family protein [Streptomyces sp. NBC_01255]
MSLTDRPASRRTILTALAAATVGAPLVGQLAVSAPAYAGTENDLYDSNTDLYTSTEHPVTEGTDYGRRYKRHEQLDRYLSKPSAPPKTAIMAIHGGQIERGTSELCLAIAGYDPANVELADVTQGFHDYWMFEGMRSENNRDLHVSSVNCDDHVAVGIAASHLNVLSLHGCQYSQLNMPQTAIWPSTADPKLVVVGGLNAAFRAALVKELNQAGFPAVDAFAPEHRENLKNYAGGVTNNICNRTATGAGAQLEITEDMRRSLFGPQATDFDWKSGRLETWDNERFRGFRDACRRAIATVESSQVIL